MDAVAGSVMLMGFSCSFVTLSFVTLSFVTVFMSLADRPQCFRGAQPGGSPASEGTGDQAAGDGNSDRCGDDPQRDRRVKDDIRRLLRHSAEASAHRTAPLTGPRLTGGCGCRRDRRRDQVDDPDTRKSDRQADRTADQTLDHRFAGDLPDDPA